MFLAFLVLVALSLSEEAEVAKNKRGSYRFYSILDNNQNNPATSGWTPIPYQTPGLGVYTQPTNPQNFNLKVVPIDSNSIEKPVQEYQEIIPPQSIGAAVLPQRPIPATPVNAAAANVPAQTGAVFLGGGSLGVVHLGNGAYALGAGSIGYSGNRAQPRSTYTVPVMPPLPATPNLIPAAVPSPVSQAPQVSSFPVGGMLGKGQVGRFDQNGYEFLPPNRIGFGMPLLRPPTIRVRQQFATPTLPQRPVGPMVQNLPSASFDFSIPIKQAYI